MTGRREHQGSDAGIVFSPGEEEREEPGLKAKFSIYLLVFVPV